MKTMKKGFTLIELIVVIAIIAILALILVPQVTGYINDANDSADQAGAKTCYTSALAVWTSEASGISSSVTVDGDCTISPAGYTDGAEANIPVSATYGGWVYTASTNAFTEAP